MSLTSRLSRTCCLWQKPCPAHHSWRKSCKILSPLNVSSKRKKTTPWLRKTGSHFVTKWTRCCFVFTWSSSRFTPALSCCCGVAGAQPEAPVLRTRWTDRHLKGRNYYVHWKDTRKRQYRVIVSQLFELVLCILIDISEIKGLII